MQLSDDPRESHLNKCLRWFAQQAATNGPTWTSQVHQLIFKKR